jgi:hypothetical protein
MGSVVRRFDPPADSHPRTLRQRLALLPARWRRPAGIALVCYSIVIVFGVTYGIVRAVSAGTSDSPAVIWGVCLAGPLALAFVWDRLSGVKVLGVELTLAHAFVPVDTTLATALSASEQQYFSGAPEILELIDKVVGDPDIELLEVNLRTTEYWWSTRLYLQAALAEDYTSIRRLVFVDGDESRRYVGMASPRRVRNALAQFEGLDLDSAYRLAQAAPGLPEHSKTEHIIYNWTQGIFTKGAIVGNEGEVKTSLSTGLLLRTVMLETDSVEWNSPLDSARFQALVLEKNARYVAITENGRLARVVNADAFARNVATQTLRARIR